MLRQLRFWSTSFSLDVLKTRWKFAQLDRYTWFGALLTIFYLFAQIDSWVDFIMACFSSSCSLESASAAIAASWRALRVSMYCSQQEGPISRGKNYRDGGAGVFLGIPPKCPRRRVFSSFWLFSVSAHFEFQKYKILSKTREGFPRNPPDIFLGWRHTQNEIARLGQSIQNNY